MLGNDLTYPTRPTIPIYWAMSDADKLFADFVSHRSTQHIYHIYVSITAARGLSLSFFGGRGRRIRSTENGPARVAAPKKYLNLLICGFFFVGP